MSISSMASSRGFRVLMPSLPEDLLPNLLSLLPAVDLLRYRCVSKSWRALIDSPYFIKLHLNTSLKVKSHKLLVVGNSVELKVSRLYGVSYDSEFKISVVRQINPPERFGLEYVIVIGSCRTITCLHYSGENDYTGIVVLWNPFLRSHRILPSSDVETEWAQGQRRGYNRYGVTYGFGYDEMTDDYKVVRFVFSSGSDDYEAKIYSLKLDTWKKIEKIPLRFSEMSRPAFVNGSIIWLLISSNTFSVLVLPLRTEVLQLVLVDSVLEGYFDCYYCSFVRIPSAFHNCNFRDSDIWKLIKYDKSGAVANFLLPDADINGGINYLMDSLDEKLCSELRSLKENLRSNSIIISLRGTCYWFDSLIRLERSNNKSKKRKSARL